ncbi:major tail protein [Cellulophaga phage phi10:1]|uniref:Phage tail protein n=1 Tax=Cellulophaga phage phi10:1 TaxID=1327981 RepID=S0A0T8_9CAUD|nr:major tail protein [Cellulophaga phage phi10:1]AGO48425.1 phage tail protein [Cellulophaga phage phi10:1]
MAGETKIKGNDFLFLVWDADADTPFYRPLACLTSNSWSSDAETIDTETKCNPGVVEKEYGAVSNSFSIEGEYIDTTSVGGYTTRASHDWLHSKQSAKQKVIIKIQTGLADNAAYYATAIVSSLELTGDVNQVATFSATLDAEGVASIDPNA